MMFLERNMFFLLAYIYISMSFSNMGLDQVIFNIVLIKCKPLKHCIKLLATLGLGKCLVPDVFRADLVPFLPLENLPSLTPFS